MPIWGTNLLQEGGSEGHFCCTVRTSFFGIDFIWSETSYSD